MSGRMKKQAVCLQMLIKTKNAKTAEGYTRTRRRRAHTCSVRMRAQHPARERANDAAREDATAEVSDQITTDSTQEREREAETSTSTTDRWILTGVASSIGGLCRHTVATSTVCVTKGTRG